MINKIQKSLKGIPPNPGVYFFKDKNGKILYVGKAKNLKQRTRSYFLPGLVSGQKTQNLVLQIKKIDYITVQSEFEALLLEAKLIKEHQPKYNLRLKDDKSYLYIKITKEDFPRIFPTRRDIGGYGPFPKAYVVRQILRQLRHIFPYRTCLKLPKKACLYFDLGLCPAPCTSKVSKENYRLSLRAIKSLLENRSLKLTESLTKTMKHYSDENKFEQAAKVRDQITKINYLIESRQNVASYLENPNLLEDLQVEEINDLRERLSTYINLRSKSLERIEAYDVSNISGKNAVSSMVVFINGSEERSYYRKFKIRFSQKPNDILMLKETLSRRLKHPEWDKPDLIIVDGGKGQVSGVLEELEKSKDKIPVLGLAKKRETLIIPQKKNGKLFFTLKNLPYKSTALNLVRRIRDEAHRFALAYHQRLRTNF